MCNSFSDDNNDSLLVLKSAGHWAEELEALMEIECESSDGSFSCSCLHRRSEYRLANGRLDLSLSEVSCGWLEVEAFMCQMESDWSSSSRASRDNRWNRKLPVCSQPLSELQWTHLQHVLPARLCLQPWKHKTALMNILNWLSWCWEDDKLTAKLNPQQFLSAFLWVILRSLINMGPSS